MLPDPDGEAYPVIPEHLRSLAGIGEALSRHGRRFGHRASFHGIRAPRYLLLSVVWGVVGVFRLAGRQLAWWWLSEQDFLRSHAVASADSREWMKLHREAKDTRRVRGIMLAGEAFALLLAVLALMRFAPWWGWLAVLRRGAARAGPRRAAGGPADHRPGHDRAPVPGAQRGRGAARLLRRRARPPRQARPANRVRVGDDPGRGRLPGEGDPAVRHRVRRRGQGQGRPGLRPGRGPLAGVPDPGQDQPPPPHAVGGRPGPAGHPRGPDAAAGRQAALDLAARPVRAR